MLYPIELRVRRGLGKLPVFFGGGKLFCVVLFSFGACVVFCGIGLGGDGCLTVGWGGR